MSVVSTSSPTSAPHLVNLRRGGTRPTLVLVSGQSGFAFIFRELAKAFDAEQPVLACQLLGVHPDEPLRAYSVEDMAAVFESQVLGAVPEGPIVLGGFSMGAFIALELAHRLEQRGREVPLLISLDAFAPGHPTLAALPSRLAAHTSAVVRAPGKYWAARVATARRVTLGMLDREWQTVRGMPLELDPVTNERVRRLAVMRRQSAAAYRPNFKLRSALLLFQCERPDLRIGSIVEPNYGWEQFVTGEIAVHRLAGVHASLLSEPENQRTIATHVGAEIERIARGERRLERADSTERSELAAVPTVDPAPPLLGLRLRLMQLLRRPKQLAMLGSALGQVCALACAPLLSRIYSPADFGVFVSFSSLFNLLNIALSLRYEQAMYYATDARAASRLSSLASSLAAVSALIFGVGAALALAFGARNDLVLVAPLAALSALASVLTRISSLLIVRWKKLRTLASINFVRPSSVALVQTVSGALFRSELTLALAHALANCLVLAFVFVRAPRLKRFLRRLAPKEGLALMREQRAFALYNLPQNLVFVASDASIPLLAASRFGHDSAGLYWFAARMTSAPMQVFVESIRAVVSDELVSTVKRGEASASWALRTSLGLAAPFLAASALLALGGPFLFEFVFGSVWRDAGPIAALLFAYAAVNAAGVPMIAALPLTGLQSAYLGVEVGVLAAKIAVVCFAVAGSSFMHTVGAGIGLAMVGYSAFYAVVWNRLRRLQPKNPGADALIEQTAAPE